MIRMPKKERQNLICNHISPEHTRRVLGGVASIKHTCYYLALYLIAGVLLGHTTTVRASSVEHTGEVREKPGLSLWEEIADMQRLKKKQDTGETEGQYMLSLLTKSNPELKSVTTDGYYFLHIYRTKEYADLNIAKYSIDDIKYRIRLPIGIHSLRILDSSNDEKDRKKRNRVFAKLLHSLYKLEFTSLVIENIKIGPEEQELLVLQGERKSTLETKRLIFRNVTTETIQVLFRRFGTVSFKRLCIEGCVGLRLDDVVKLRKKKEIERLELTDVTNLNDYQAFIEGISDLKQLKIKKVVFRSTKGSTKQQSTSTSTDQEFIQLVSSLLPKLEGTLEIDWTGYKQMQKEKGWPECASRISQLHLMDIGHVMSMEKELEGTASVFTSLTTLTLSVKHPQLLAPSLLSSIIEYAKKHHKGVKNVVVLGKMNIEEVEKAINDDESELAQILQAHKDTHFTFTDSTEIEAGRKHLLFIPFSLYNKASNMELRNRLGVLEEISNWDWDKQKRAQLLCRTCNNARQEGYVTQQQADGRIICDHLTRYNIQRQKGADIADKNFYLKTPKYIWYPKHIIFLHPELDGQVYLAETEDTIEKVLKNRKELMVAKPKAKGAKRPAGSTNTMQEAAIGTSIANTGAADQQQELQLGSNRHMREYIVHHIDEPTTQPSAAKQPRYESAVSNRIIFEQSVVSGREQEMVQPKAMDMPRQLEMQLEKELQQYIDAEMALSQNESRPRDQLDEMLEEIIEPEVQQAEQPQAMAMFGGLPVLTNEDLEKHLGMDTTEPEEELVYTQL